MNPRLFCREKGYGLAICLSYSFDPMFFERVILHDLWAGESSDILVIADHGQLNDVLPKSVGQLNHLGRRYRLAPAEVLGRQHAKLILRVGKKSALVWLGSNNLTFSGWSGQQGNLELATAWRIDQSDENGAAMLRSVLNSVSNLVHGRAADVVDRALDCEWISNAPTDPAPKLLISTVDNPLGPELLKRLHGRRFDTIRIMTGSTDEDGAFLAWSARELGVRTAVVALDPRRCSFRADKIKKLPIDVRFIALPQRPLPHAKFLWLEGSEGNVAVVGSANCSGAAWIYPCGHGGNIESVLVFNEAREEDFDSVLSLFRLQQLTTDEVPDLGAGSQSGEPASSDSHRRVVELSWSAQSSLITARLAVPLSSTFKVEAELGSTTLELQAVDASRLCWAGHLEQLPPAWGTNFARLAFRRGPQTEYSNQIWITEEEILQQASRMKNVEGTISGLGLHLPSNEQRKLLEQLSQVATVLFADARAFPDPPVGGPASASTTNAQSNIEPIDPDALVKSICEIGNARAHGNESVSTGLPIFGAIRVLFPQDEFDIDLPSGDDDLDGENGSGGSPDEPNAPGVASPPPPTHRDPPPAKLRQQLEKQINKFLDNLAQARFGESCTATQLVQAVAFPLAIATKAFDGGWIDEHTLSQWTFRVTDLLFRVKYKQVSTATGLLRVVEERYRKEDRCEIYERTLGNGVLWVALTAALQRVGLHTHEHLFERALAIREVFREQSLLTRIDAHRLAALLASSAQPADSLALLKAAQTGAADMNGLEKCLVEGAQGFYAFQDGGMHRRGDLVWRNNVGFGVVQDDASIRKDTHLSVYLRHRGANTKVIATYYVNLRLTAQSDSRLAALMEKVARGSTDLSKANGEQKYTGE